MKLTPAYVRSEMQRISEERRINANAAVEAGFHTASVWAQSNGQLRGLLDSLLTFGLADEMTEG